MESEATKEKGSSGVGPAGGITLQKAVELGEYKPEYLGKFPEWKLLSKHAQLQLIRQGIRNRKTQLMNQYASLFNVLDFRLKKPELEPRLNHILELVKQVDMDEEYFLAHYV